MSNISKRIFYFLTGFVYIALGSYVFANPGVTIVVLVNVLALLMIAAGVFTLIEGMRMNQYEHTTLEKGLEVFEGVVVIVLGFIFWFGSDVFGAVVLAYMMVFWFIVLSISHISFAMVALKGWGRIILLALNVFLLIFSVSLLFNPVLAAGTMVWFVGFQFYFMAMDRFLHAFLPARPEQ